jgi:hypothetical protein
MGTDKTGWILSNTLRKLGALATMAGIVSAFSFGGCDSRQKPAASRPPVIIVSGDTGPWIVPCGCTANQAGGLARRATVLQQARAAGPVVYLDVGGAAAGTSEYFKQKFTAVLRGEKLMGVAVHNLGKAEIELGALALDEASAATGVQFISANVLRSNGQPLTRPMDWIDAGGKRVAVIGVVSPRYASGTLQVTEPRAAIAKLLQGSKRDYDSLIVLAYMPEDELSALAANLPEADVVVGGPTGQAMTPRKVGPTLVASATNKGKFLVKLTGQAKGWGGEVIEVAHTYAEDANQQENLAAYLKTLETLDLPAEQTGLVQPILNPPANYRVAGSASCVACHQADNDVWAHSKHAHAGETLVAKGFQVDAYCLQCHTTGFALPGGFSSPRRTPALAAVGCEGCHGPSAAHVKDSRLRTPFAAFDQCIRCHDHENSPTFNRDTYWAKIVHGKKEAAK